ncbi:hypothetical protein TVAG_497390 [Trichomonas vaginalis G3]|uniref:FUZ/MON1/HPS1 first Longin domain-containing protein n=1 Tax=Trichomonas vaginalis (strain ATCC PRA-98 / G3) TaxID=412133 RepID=A2EGY1_TRIV3|nr:protein transport [Trichomonas vaginalis G3]EAY08115.1 hypothetical protein TVAG_497390 [Trichomonas vaginalis G3]KAI5496670.1 protein transport [Trichomonas vaginalis G3]|eukprot:XP_001320338.1 hypothetical protein [Trichomonas vaginalis G3]
MATSEENANVQQIEENKPQEVQENTPETTNNESEQPNQENKIENTENTNTESQQNIESAKNTDQPKNDAETPKETPKNGEEKAAPLYWLSRTRSEESTDPVDMRPDSEEWTSQELHLFIVTDAGKPVYSRYGTVQKLSPILCTCVAILGHMESLHEELNHFRAGSHTFVFLPKSPFVFIAVSKSSLPVSYLFKQLNFLYSLFLSLFSENLINQLSARPACDFRQIAEGTRPAWDGVVNNMSEDPAFIFAPSVPVSHMRPEQRAAVISHFDKLPSCKLSMLMYRNRVLAVGKCSCDSLSLRLIVDLMWTPAFQNGESWTPFFARDSTDGMHHLYINKHKSSDFALVMLCSDSPNLGVAYHSAATHIFAELEEKYIATLEKPLDWEPKVFYCWALHSITYGQVYITDPISPHFKGQKPQDSIKKMQELSKQLAKSCDMVETNAVDGEYMFRDEKEVIVVYKCSTHEIYAVANSADLKDSELSAKLQELKNFINAHFNELIIVESKFHINKFT